MGILENFWIKRASSPFQKAPAPGAEELLSVLTDMHFREIPVEQITQRLNQIGIQNNIPELQNVVIHELNEVGPIVTNILKQMNNSNIVQEMNEQVGYQTQASKKYNYEVLKTKQEQIQGLQFRASLDPNTVLVFKNVGDEGVYFHSENCKFAFSIAFLDQDNRILKATSMYPPSDKLKAPKGTVHVAEASLGFFDRFSIGDQLEVPNE